MKNLSLSSLLPILLKLARQLQPYLNVILFVMFALVYALTIVKINSLSSAPVDQGVVADEVKASPTPRIDASAAEQLQTLKDNSVNVQTLFDDTRSSPFEE
jgi:hypothetical protein